MTNNKDTDTSHDDSNKDAGKDASRDKTESADKPESTGLYTEHQEGKNKGENNANRNTKK